MKDQSDMFRIVCDPSSGSIKLYLNEIRSGSLMWTTANFSQVQLYTPWWWIVYDPKHVGVIFDFMSFKNFYTT